MHSAADHDCNINDRFGKPSCMTEFEQEIREDERERAVQRVEDMPDWSTTYVSRVEVIAAIKRKAMTEHLPECPSAPALTRKPEKSRQEMTQ
jgi:hypothetical protein